MSVVVNMENSPDWSSGVGLVSTGQIKVGSRLETLASIKIGSSSTDVGDASDGGFCDGSYYRLDSNQAPASSSPIGSSNVPQKSPSIPGWKLTQSTDNVEKTFEKIDEAFSVGSSVYNKMLDHWKKKAYKILPSPHAGDGAPSAEYIKRNNIFQFRLKMHNNENGTKMYINPEMPYYKTESGGKTIYRIYGDHDPYFVPGLIAKDGASEVVEFISDPSSGKGPVFKTMDQSKRNDYIKNKIDLFLNLAKANQKLMHLRLYEGANMTYTDEYTEISSELGGKLLNVHRYDAGDLVLTQLSAILEKLVEDSDELAKKYCSTNSTNYKGDKPTYPRYTGILQLAVVPNLSKIENRLRTKYPDGNFDKAIDAFLKMTAPINTPQKYFAWHVTTQMALKGTADDQFNYIENAGFSGNVTFNPMSDSEMDLLKGVDVQVPSIGVFEDTATAIDESKKEDYSAQSVTATMIHTSDTTTSSSETKETNLPRTKNGSKGTYVDSVKSGSKSFQKTGAKHGNVARSMGNQINAIMGKKPNKSNNWDKLSHLSRMVGSAAGEAWDWATDWDLDFNEPNYNIKNLVSKKNWK